MSKETTAKISDGEYWENLAKTPRRFNLEKENLPLPEGEWWGRLSRITYEQTSEGNSDESPK